MNVCCFLCGAPIFSGGITGDWMSEFRALYGEQEVWDNPRISGIGDLTFDEAVPIDFDAHITDANLLARDKREVSFCQARFPYEPPPQHPESHSPVVWGFPGHVSCWQLLSDIYHPAEIDLHGLSLLCRSSPSERFHCLDLGLNYGDLWIWKFGKTFYNDVTLSDDDLPLLPGEERKVNSNLTRDEWPNADIYHANPLEFPGLIEHSLSSSQQADAAEAEELVENSTCKTRQPRFDDCFACLPAEILELILCELPSNDVVRLELASPTFSSTSLGAQFWASRFRRGSEFECLLNLHPLLRHRIDWKASYIQAKAIKRTPNFQNRKRIWRILLQLQDLLLVMSQSEVRGLPLRSYFETNEPEDLTVWRRSCAKLRRPSDQFKGGSRALRARKAVIPLRAVRMSVSLVKLGGVEYVSGLRFLPRHGPAAEIGYVNSQREVCLDLGDLNGRKIDGFKLAIDRKGIRAIGVSLGEANISEMVGDCTAPQMLVKAITQDETMPIRCDLDGLKMLSLAVPKETLEEVHDFRYDFLWFPELPANDSHLSTPHFSNETKEYHAFTTCTFGGSQGTLLKNIIGIAVSEYEYGVWGMEFRYNIDIGGQSSLILGRPWHFEHYIPMDRQHRKLLKASKRTVISVDGPGGEIITGIDVRHGTGLRCFRIHTSYGRQETFPRDLLVEASDQLVPLSLPEGHTIIGFYSELENVTVLKSLGIISKKL